MAVELKSALEKELDKKIADDNSITKRDKLAKKIVDMAIDGDLDVIEFISRTLNPR